MASKIRTCPHCGAGVIGDTDVCPRCEQALEPDSPPATGSAANSLPAADSASATASGNATAASPAPAADAYSSYAPAGAGDPTSPEARTQSTGVQAPPRLPLPPAPYTPPPVVPDYSRTMAPYNAEHYLEQRMNAYRQGGYDFLSRSPYQITMAYGKPLNLLWWLTAILSGVGLLWYLMIMLFSGFRKDKVYLVLERDGAIYEDGAGAAHTRRRRARIGQRWGMIGVVIFFLSLLWLAGMVVGGILALDEYRAELEAAYPTVSIFAADPNTPPPTNLNPEDVRMAENGLLAFSVLTALAGIGVFSGLLLTIVGYLHGAAYRVNVPPLPEYL